MPTKRSASSYSARADSKCASNHGAPLAAWPVDVIHAPLMGSLRGSRRQECSSFDGLIRRLGIPQFDDYGQFELEPVCVQTTRTSCCRASGTSPSSIQTHPEP